MSINNEHPKVAVLNIDTNQVVYIPISDKAVIKQGGILHGLTVRMPIISDSDFQALASLVVINPHKACDNEDYFLYRCITYASENHKDFFSPDGYLNIYKYLDNQGFNMKTMIEQIPKITEVFIESDQQMIRIPVFCASYSTDNGDRHLYLNAVVKQNPMRLDANHKEVLTTEKEGKYTTKVFVDSTTGQAANLKSL